MCLLSYVCEMVENDETRMFIRACNGGSDFHVCLWGEDESKGSDLRDHDVFKNFIKSSGQMGKRKYEFEGFEYGKENVLIKTIIKRVLFEVKLINFVYHDVFSFKIKSY